MYLQKYKTFDNKRDIICKKHGRKSFRETESPGDRASGRRYPPKTGLAGDTRSPEALSEEAFGRRRPPEARSPGDPVSRGHPEKYFVQFLLVFGSSFSNLLTYFLFNNDCIQVQNMPPRVYMNPRWRIPR